MTLKRQAFPFLCRTSACFATLCSETGGSLIPSWWRGITSLLHKEISVKMMTQSVALFTSRHLSRFSTLFISYFGNQNGNNCDVCKILCHSWENKMLRWKYSFYTYTVNPNVAKRYMIKHILVINVRPSLLSGCLVSSFFSFLLYIFPSSDPATSVFSYISVLPAWPKSRIFPEAFHLFVKTPTLWCLDNMSTCMLNIWTPTVVHRDQYWDSVLSLDTESAGNGSWGLTAQSKVEPKAHSEKRLDHVT